MSSEGRHGFHEYSRIGISASVLICEIRVSSPSVCLRAGTASFRTRRRPRSCERGHPLINVRVYAAAAMLTTAVTGSLNSLSPPAFVADT